VASWDADHAEIPLDPAPTAALLAGAGLACPPIDGPLAARHIDWFHLTGAFD
jgi:hypothetical protein